MAGYRTKPSRPRECRLKDRAARDPILVTFEQSAASIRRNAATLGWNLAPLEQAAKLLTIEAAVPTGVVQAGDFDIGGLLGILAGHIRALGARRIVIGAADLLLRLFRDPCREEDQLIVLHNWLLEQEQTVLLTVKTGSVAAEPVASARIPDGLRLAARPPVLGQVSTRRLRVIKFRGPGSLSNEYPYLIAQGGRVLMPISGTSLTDRALGPRFASGVAGFDDAIHGGFFQGRHVFIDAISACQRMGSHEAAFDFLLRLLTYCKGRGTTCIYVNQTDPDHVVDRISGIGISSLIDALIVLRQEWNPAGDHRREALIVKIRGSSHSHRQASDAARQALGGGRWAEFRGGAAELPAPARNGRRLRNRPRGRGRARALSRSTGI